MKRLGVVENLAYDGTVLVRAETAPPRGAEVVDRRHHPVGTIVKVFGPVKEPYVSLRPRAAPSPNLIGAELFLEEGEHAEQKDRRGRRSH